jgi:hypothetical protein
MNPRAEYGRHINNVRDKEVHVITQQMQENMQIHRLLQCAENSDIVLDNTDTS